MVGRGNGVYRCVKAFAVDLSQRCMQLVHVRHQYTAQDVLLVHGFVGYLNALNGSQPGADHFLQLLSHFRISVIAQLCCKANHCGLADADSLPELAGGHKRRFVIVFYYIIRNSSLPLGEPDGFIR